MTLKPLASNVLIEPAPIEETTKSGILLPGEARKKTSQGKVVAVGNAVEELREGDQVLFREYGPEKVKVEGQELLVCEEKDIIAVIT